MAPHTPPPQHFPITTWRVIQNPASGGAWNMAVDEAILESVGRGDSLPTLRLYAWEPPCLSIGYAQTCSDVDLTRLLSSGWHLVRRPTGGRAILHTDELTYAVIGPHSESRLAGSVLDTYRSLGTALLDAIHRLNVPAESLVSSTPSSNHGKGPVCFEVPSNYEITIRGKKLAGSAQARRKEGVLQHGSLPLCGDLARITMALSFPDEPARQSAAQRVHARATTLEEVLRHPVGWDVAAQAFIAAFQETLHLELLPGVLSPSERARAQELVAEKYANPAWTEKT